MDVSPPVVAFDFDGVLCRPPFGLNPGSGRRKRRDAPGKKGILWLTERWRYYGRQPMPGALRALESVNEFARPVVVSARGEQARGLTEAWLERHLGWVPELHLRPHWRETSAQFKIRRLGELGAFAHFEDDPHTALWAADTVPMVFVVDWPRNRWVDDPRLHRIHRLSEAVPQIAAALGRPAAPDG
jgi:hypothetical protein